jgi:hypothetical protein
LAPEINIIKPFSLFLLKNPNNVVLAPDKPFKPGLIFVNKDRVYLRGASFSYSLKDSPQALQMLNQAVMASQKPGAVFTALYFLRNLRMCP